MMASSVGTSREVPLWVLVYVDPERAAGEHQRMQILAALTADSLLLLSVLSVASSVARRLVPAA